MATRPGSAHRRGLPSLSGKNVGMGVEPEDQLLKISIGHGEVGPDVDERPFPYPDTSAVADRYGTVYLRLDWERDPPLSGYWDASPDRSPTALEDYPESYDWKDGVLWGQRRAKRVLLNLYGAGFVWFGADPPPVENTPIREPDPVLFSVVEEALAALDAGRHGPWELGRSRS